MILLVYGIVYDLQLSYDTTRFRLCSSNER